MIRLRLMETPLMNRPAIVTEVVLLALKTA
jgi:hypothetical protein